MKRSRPWLHLLLTVSLIFNGMTAVHAATSMSLRHASTAAASEAATHAPAAPATARAAVPCHAASTSQPAPVAVAGLEPGPHLAADCCESGSCNCECVHQSQAAPAAVLAIGTPVPQVNHVGSASRAHAEAVLPHLIRPPIA